MLGNLFVGGLYAAAAVHHNFNRLKRFSTHSTRSLGALPLLSNLSSNKKLMAPTTRGKGKAAVAKLKDLSKKLVKAHNHSHAKKAYKDGPKGRSSVGDQIRPLYTGAKKNYKRKGFKRFQRKVERALQGELPLMRFVQVNAKEITNGARFTGFDTILNIMDNATIVNVASTLIQTAQASAVAKLLEGRIIIESVIVDLFLKNNSAGYLCVDLYHVKAKVDNNRSAIQDLSQYTGNSITATPAGEQQTDGAGVGQGFTLSGQSNWIGQSPFMATGFSTKWNIKSCERLILQPGEMKNFIFTRKYGKVIDLARLQQSGALYAATKGLTETWFAYVRGDLGATAGGVPETSSGQLDTYHSIVYRGRPMFAGPGTSVPMSTTIYDNYGEGVGALNAVAEFLTGTHS